MSARDWVAPIAAATGTMGPIIAWEHNRLGKQFPTFCPMGPALVTRDEIRDPHDDLIAYYAQFYLLRPGDVITTGSPLGVGYGREPKLFLRAGDTVEVSAAGIGTLANPVVAG